MADTIRITDVFKTEYLDFVEFCESIEKLYTFELDDIDYFTFRTQYGVSRQYVSEIKEKINNFVPQTFDENPLTITPFEDEQVDDSEDANADIVLSLENKLDKTVPDGAPGNEPIFESLSEAPQTILPDESENAVASDGSQEEDAVSLFISICNNHLTPLYEIINVNPSLYWSIDVQTINLSVRSSNCLKKAKIISMEDLLRLSFDDLKNVRNLGLKSAHEIVNKAIDTVLNGAGEIPLMEKPSEVTSIKVSSSFVEMIKNFLSGQEIDELSLDENESLILEKVKESVETVGKDILLDAINNSDYYNLLSEALSEFYAPYISHINLRDTAKAKISDMCDEIKECELGKILNSFYVGPRGQSSYSFLGNLEQSQKVNSIWNDAAIFEFDNAQEMLFTNFLNWLSVTPGERFKKFSKIITTLTDKEVEVLTLRANKLTLEAISAKYGLTRERIRQIEAKALRKIRFKFYNRKFIDFDLISYIAAIYNFGNIISVENVSRCFDESIRPVIDFLKDKIVYSDYYIYDNESDSFVLAGSIDYKPVINEYIDDMPSFILSDEFDYHIEEIAVQNSIPFEIINSYVNSLITRIGKIVYRSKPVKSDICEYILKNYFPGGYKISDEDAFNRFQKALDDLGISSAYNFTMRAVDALMQKHAFLLDRGKWIHEDYVIVPDDFENVVYEYVDSSPRITLTYSELFDELSDYLTANGIGSRYALQGAISKANLKYDTARDYITKDWSCTFTDELLMYMENHKAVHKEEIFAYFKSLDEVALSNIIVRCPEILCLDNGYYAHINNYDISENDKGEFKNYLKNKIRDLPVNSRAIFNDFQDYYSEFLDRNNIHSHSDLFAILRFLFEDAYDFSKPYVSKIGTGSVTNRDAILGYLEDYDEIDLDELLEICDENHLHFASNAYLLQTISPEFILINPTTLMRYENVGLDDEKISEVVESVKNMISSSGYIASTAIDDFIWFPQLNTSWNSYLLDSIILLSNQICCISMQSSKFGRQPQIYVSEEYKDLTFQQFILEILKVPFENENFSNKNDIKEWLSARKLANSLPNFLEGNEYFYMENGRLKFRKDK